ncbi:LacI family DNA-binding transcriptional regulator [Devosia aquimaris]|uniref:LacI family DNA-binding transcriptional regulator n=1 Tax=Devosia aquimaris TaxID=2866214 RepID=UPI001CD14DF6|nr:LacI family DNA-binding transcriptional regulator [Devosia sp. CJK-A8-3]
MSPKITIMDVASAAGVSRGAVTRALNDKADINPETKKRVLEVAAQLGYRPSRFARNFAARTKSRAIGYVVTSFRNPYFTDLAADMLMQAKARNWQVAFDAMEGSSEREALERLSEHVDVVVGHFDLPSSELKQASGGVPVIRIEGTSNLPGVHAIDIDLRGGLHDAITALIAKGVTHFGMIDATNRGADHVMDRSPRCGYFSEFVPEHSRNVVVADEESLAGGERAIARLLQAHPDVGAVFAFNDIMAIGAMHGARVAGFDVPRQLRVMGIDGLTLGEATAPSLSSISIDRETLVSEIFAISEQIAEAGFRDIESINRQILPRPLWRESA